MGLDMVMFVSRSSVCPHTSRCNGDLVSATAAAHREEVRRVKHNTNSLSLQLGARIDEVSAVQKATAELPDRSGNAWSRRPSGLRDRDLPVSVAQPVRDVKESSM